MMKKIVVFGASGDTGQYFVKYFLEHYVGDEYQVIATGTRETHYFEQFEVPYYRVDITKKKNFPNCQTTSMPWLTLPVQCQRE